MAECISQIALLASGSPMLSVRLSGRKTVIFIPASVVVSEFPESRQPLESLAGFLKVRIAPPFSEGQERQEQEHHTPA